MDRGLNRKAVLELAALWLLSLLGGMTIPRELAPFPNSVAQGIGAGLIPFFIGLALYYWRRERPHRLRDALIVTGAIIALAAWGAHR